MPSDNDLLFKAIHAATHSRDKSSWNAALLVPRSMYGTPVYQPLVATNGFTQHGPISHERPDKYLYTEHAERAVLYRAARLGIPTDGATMYCPWAACADCARAIVMAGVSRLVRLPTVGHGHWQESIDAGEQILRNNHVTVVESLDEFGVQILRDGKLIEV